MSEEDQDDKQHEPTQQKIDQARKRGELVKSAELSVAATYGGFLIAATVMGGYSITQIGTQAMVLIEQSDSLSREMLGGGGHVAGGVLGSMGLALAPWFLIPMALVLLSLFGQQAIVFAPEKLMPQLSRVNPISNFGQKFGRAGLFEFVKNFVKLLVIAVLLGVYLTDKTPEILTTQWLEPVAALAMLGDLTIGFVAILFGFSLVIGAIDYLWQRAEFMRRNRMSRQELVDEMKNSEGDPHIKAQRRQRAIAIAMNAMMKDVPKADVIIVNPTHYAVALQWQRGSGRAPICVAKGVDEVAAKIREIAQEAGVPIHSDPPTARAIYAAVNIGDEIRPQHFKPVAAAIRFAEKMRQRARAMGRGRR